MQARLRKTMQLSVLVDATGMEIVIIKNINLFLEEKKSF